MIAEPMAYEVVCSADDERWHEERRRLVTATTAPQLLGVHRYGSLLGTFLRMRGVEQREEGDRSYLDWGTDMEHAVVANMRRRGFDVVLSRQLLRSRHWPWMGATLDGWVLEDGKPRYPFQIKTTRSKEQAKAWEEDVPAEVTVQCQHELAVTLTPRELVAVVVFGSPPRYAWVERDLGMTAQLAGASKAFFDRVQAGDPPEADAGDARVPERVVRGKKAELAIEAVTLTEEWESAKLQRDMYAERCDALKAKIARLLGDASVGTLPGDVGRWQVVEAHRRGYVKVTGMPFVDVAAALGEQSKNFGLDSVEDTVSRSLRLFGR